MDEAFNSDTSTAGLVCDQIFFKFSDAPNTNSGVFASTNFCGRSHARHLGSLSVRRLNSLPESVCDFKSGILRDVNIMNDEVPARRGTLDGASHWLG
jgi:hypothetical protein